MDLKKLFNDDDAVSPVIGVILMVAITVILAAVIASVVLGLGDSASEQTPQASFSFDYDNGGSPELTITHDGGDSIDRARLSVIDGGSTAGGSWSSSEVSAGDSYDISTLSGSSGDTVSVVWTDADEESSATLAEYEIP